MYILKWLHWHDMIYRLAVFHCYAIVGSRLLTPTATPHCFSMRRCCAGTGGKIKQSATGHILEYDIYIYVHIKDKPYIMCSYIYIFIIYICNMWIVVLILTDLECDIPALIQPLELDVYHIAGRSHLSNRRKRAGSPGHWSLIHGWDTCSIL